MPRDDLYLLEIIEAADRIVTWLTDVTIERWIEDELLRSAVLQKLTVIGEAARGLDRSLRDRHLQVPWPRIVAFRNVAVHEYFAVEWPTVWPVATVEVPDLREKVFGVLRDEFPDVAERVRERG